MKSWILSIALLVCAGCAALGIGQPDAQWQTITVKGMPWEDLWMNCLDAMRQARFSVAQENITQGQIISAWKENLSPYSRQENRERATIEILKTGEQEFRVRARVQAQRNTEMSRTLEVRQADWKDKDDHPEIAKFIVQTIYLKTKTFGPSEEFYKKKSSGKELPN